VQAIYFTVAFDIIVCKIYGKQRPGCGAKDTGAECGHLYGLVIGKMFTPLPDGWLRIQQVSKADKKTKKQGAFVHQFKVTEPAGFNSIYCKAVLMLVLPPANG
jgi:hypothetical protein